MNSPKKGNLTELQRDNQEVSSQDYWKVYGLDGAFRQARYNSNLFVFETKCWVRKGSKAHLRLTGGSLGVGRIL